MSEDPSRLSRVVSHSSDPGNPPLVEIAEVIRSSRRIAVVGLSRDPAKAARSVPAYLAANDYEVIPVNPNADRIMGRLARDHLDEVQGPVDLVLVFRPSGEAGQVIRSAAGRSDEPVIWLQEGIRNDEAAAEARRKGRTVVQDLCLSKAHAALGEPPRS